jgi:CRISPR/Cas system CSM-associated protein Csm4 (group 5 of RAMP superfamily)
MLCISRINIIKMTILPKVIYMLNAILIKISNAILHTKRKISPKVHLKAQKTLNSWINSEQKEQNWRYHIACLQTILQTHSNGNSMVLVENKHEGQKNRIEDQETNWCTYGCIWFDFDTGSKNICWRNDFFFNKCYWKKLNIRMYKFETRPQSLIL